MNKLTSWSLFLGIVIALGTLVAWPTGLARDLVTHFQTVGANTTWIAQVEFNRLNAIRDLRPLTREEHAAWCRFGYRLEYFTKQFPCPPPR